MKLYPLTHFLVALFISEIFVYSNEISHKLAILSAIVAVLIDLDHLFAYFHHHKKLSIKQAWNSSILHEHNRTFIHHRAGLFLALIIIVIFFAFNWKISLILAIAYFSHMLLDALHLHTHKTFNITELGYKLKIPYYEFCTDIILIILLLFIFI